jgi:hypothetical protein
MSRKAIRLHADILFTDPKIGYPSMSVRCQLKTEMGSERVQPETDPCLVRDFVTSGRSH